MITKEQKRIALKESVSIVQEHQDSGSDSQLEEDIYNAILEALKHSESLQERNRELENGLKKALYILKNEYPTKEIQRRYGVDEIEALLTNK